MNALRLYGRYVAASLRAQFAYPGTLALMSAGQFLVTVIEFAGGWALFKRFGTIGGWRLGEVALFYGFVSVVSNEINETNLRSRLPGARRLPPPRAWPAHEGRRCGYT